jgi:hypothetical protein
MLMGMAKPLVGCVPAVVPARGCGPFFVRTAKSNTFFFDTPSSMNSVNPYFLHTLLEPLTGLADDDMAVQAYAKLDPNDELQMRAIIRETIVPHALSISRNAMKRVKLAYKFYLSKPDANFERVFYSTLPPFDAPNDPRQFFVWIWDECFVGEDFRLTNLEEYIENPDVNEPLRI